MGARVGAEVGGTVRGSARHGGGQGAAARRHSEQQQLSTWCTGRGGEAAGDERAAGWRRRTLARDPSTRAACVHALRAAARAQVAKGSVCAECEMRRRRAAGRRRRTFGARPKHKGRLARGTWWRAVRTGSNEGQAHSCCPGSGSQSERALSRYEVENELHYVEGIHNVLHNTFGMKLLHIGVMKCFITRFIT
jgi:hypothetical protein